jgi:hypothetical protein
MTFAEHACENIAIFAEENIITGISVLAKDQMYTM